MPFPVYDDEDAMNGIVRKMLVAAGVDCLTSNEAGNGGLSDDAQLAFAAAHGHAIITHNMKDFLRIYGEWAHAPGVTMLASSSSLLNETHPRWCLRSSWNGWSSAPRRIW